MSTTIVNAYRLHPDVKLPEFAQKLRTHVTPLVYSSVKQRVFSDAVFSYDIQKDYTKTLAEHVKDEWRKLQDLLKENSGVLNSSFVVFADTEDVSELGNPRYYVKFLAGNAAHVQSDDLNEVMSGLPDVDQEYDYWNGTDSQLEHMTVEQWHERRDFWNRLVPLNRDINLYGVTVQITNSVEVRVNVHAQDILEDFEAGEFGEVSQKNRTKRRIGVLVSQYLMDALPADEAREFIMDHVGVFLGGYKTVFDMPGIDEHPEVYLQAVERGTLDVENHPL